MTGATEKTIREALAALEHEQWSHWTAYMLDTLAPLAEYPRAPGSGAALDAIARWRRQIGTPYADLTEKEKDSDRVWADKALALLDDRAEMRQALAEAEAREAVMRGALEHCVDILPGGARSVEDVVLPEQLLADTQTAATARDARVRAEALREAASGWEQALADLRGGDDDGLSVVFHDAPSTVATWLRARAEETT